MPNNINNNSNNNNIDNNSNNNNDVYNDDATNLICPHVKAYRAFHGFG